MSTDERILEELRLIRIALQAVAPKRWQKVPAASVTLDVPQSTLRRLVNLNRIPIRVTNKTRQRKSFEIDTVKTRQLLEDGMLLRKVK